MPFYFHFTAHTNLSLSGNTARGGTVTIAENGLGVSYVPPPGQTGSDIAKYIACDQDGACGEAFVFITIVDEQSSTRRRHLRKDSVMQQQHDHSRSYHGHGPNHNAALIAALLDALGGDNNIMTRLLLTTITVTVSICCVLVSLVVVRYSKQYPSSPIP